MADDQEQEIELVDITVEGKPYTVPQKLAIFINRVDPQDVEGIDKRVVELLQRKHKDIGGRDETAEEKSG